jgi:hypothetical protein
VTHSELLAVLDRGTVAIPDEAGACPGDIAEILAAVDQTIGPTGRFQVRRIAVLRCGLCASNVVTADETRLLNHYVSVSIPCRAVAAEDPAR